MKVDYNVDIPPMFCIDFIHFMSVDAQRFLTAFLLLELRQTFIDELSVLLHATITLVDFLCCLCYIGH